MIPSHLDSDPSLPPEVLETFLASNPGKAGEKAVLAPNADQATADIAKARTNLFEGEMFRMLQAGKSIAAALVTLENGKFPPGYSVGPLVKEIRRIQNILGFDARVALYKKREQTLFLRVSVPEEKTAGKFRTSLDQARHSWEAWQKTQAELNGLVKTIGVDRNEAGQIYTAAAHTLDAVRQVLLALGKSDGKNLASLVKGPQGEAMQGGGDADPLVKQISFTEGELFPQSIGIDIPIRGTGGEYVANERADSGLIQFLNRLVIKRNLEGKFLFSVGKSYSEGSGVFSTIHLELQADPSVSLPVRWNLEHHQKKVIEQMIQEEQRKLAS